jgi:translation initiation factor IF-3
LKLNMKPTKQDSTRINEMIRSLTVRVINEDGVQIGVINRDEAIKMALEQGLDLVEVSPNTSPPVCKIMDYGKYKYRLAKKTQLAKKKQKVFQVKEVKLRPKTDEHDYLFKLKHIQRFIGDGNKVKVTVMFRGRELAHVDLGKKILERVIAEVGETAMVEMEPRLEGRNMNMVLAPKS